MPCLLTTHVNHGSEQSSHPPYPVFHLETGHLHCSFSIHCYTGLARQLGARHTEKVCFRAHPGWDMAFTVRGQIETSSSSTSPQSHRSVGDWYRDWALPQKLKVKKDVKGGFDVVQGQQRWRDYLHTPSESRYDAFVLFYNLPTALISLQSLTVTWQL